MKGCFAAAAACCLVLASCAPAPQPAAPAAPAAPSVRRSAPPMPALGSFSGATTGKQPATTIQAEFRAGGEAAWVEKTGASKAEFVGRWRREEERLLVLLYPKTEGRDGANLLLEQKGDGWIMVRRNTERIDASAAIVLKPR